MFSRLRLSAYYVLLIILYTSAALGRSAHADVPKDVAAATVAYTSGRGGIQLVKVKVNRTQAAIFMFDSGANYSAISDALVKLLKLQPSPALTSLGDSMMDSFKPGKPLQCVLLSSVAVGDLSIKNSRFVILDAKSLQAFGPAIDGILGANLAAKCPTLLDFQKHQLTFLRRSPTPDDLKKIGMSDAVSVPVQGCGQKLTLQISDKGWKQK